MKHLFRILLFNGFAVLAIACPFCHSEAGAQVRSGIFDADFGYHLLVTFIPFAIFLGIAALIYFGVPGGLRADTAGRGESL